MAEVLRAERAIEFAARNPHRYAVTLTLEPVELRNMRAAVRLPWTGTVPAGSTRRLFRAEALDPRLPWRLPYRFWWRAGSLEAQPDSGHVYTLPYAPGSAHRVIKGFAEPATHQGQFQYAVDFEMPEGTAVHAARAGTVVDVLVEHSENGPDAVSNYILVEHADGTHGAYYHLQRGGAAVRPGERVEAGQRIGSSGNTGPSGRPHLHFHVAAAVDGRTLRTVRPRFRSAEGVAAPEKGRTYTAVAPAAD